MHRPERRGSTGATSACRVTHEPVKSEKGASSTVEPMWNQAIMEAADFGDGARNLRLAKPQ
jgi:hypothetical protein